MTVEQLGQGSGEHQAMKGQKEAQVSESLSLEKGKRIQGWLKRLSNQVGRAKGGCRVRPMTGWPTVAPLIFTRVSSHADFFAE